MKTKSTSPGSLSPIECCCAVTHAPEIGPTTFTNVNPLWHPPWHPPGGAGIYGGVAIAQCLNAAYATVPDNIAAHSMHCHFLVAAISDVPVFYSVDVVRDGRSFMTRSVRAFQGGTCFFSTIISFQRVSSTLWSTVLEHAVQPPVDLVPPPALKDISHSTRDTEEPFEIAACGYAPGVAPATRKQRKWIRAHGKIAGLPHPHDGTQPGPVCDTDIEAAEQRAHICALAYMSDSDFVNTISRVHRLWQFATPEYQNYARDNFQGSELDRIRMETWLQGRARDEARGNEEAAAAEGTTAQKRVGMLLSLNHTIFFHNHQRLRADEWLFCELKCPWTGNERGLVTQNIWTAEGVLVATCIQEGVVRVIAEEKGRL
ncbi:acyl-CoA thioesterase [Aspergillus lucknowensis]|uniref:Thioesterase-like superfamily-domain-containing protein n=1 Tax=Aspergillus lucknowensis TaxID=176173 RepID=A0ABR4M3U8_9EURO